MKLHESGEDYLEVILRLSRTQSTVRSVDVAAELGYSKPSVSIAMKHLREGGLVIMEPDGNLLLTPEGRAIAEQVWERHRVVTALLTHLGVSPDVAHTDACKIEHDLSEETFTRIKEWVTTQENAPN